MGGERVGIDLQSTKFIMQKSQWDMALGKYFGGGPTNSRTREASKNHQKFVENQEAARHSSESRLTIFCDIN